MLVNIFALNQNSLSCSIFCQQCPVRFFHKYQIEPPGIGDPHFYMQKPDRTSLFFVMDIEKGTPAKIIVILIFHETVPF